MADQPCSQAVAAFASLGAGGRHESNQERDLHRWLKQLWRLELQPYTLMLEVAAQIAGDVPQLLRHITSNGPGKVGEENNVELMDVPALLPHEILRSVEAAGSLQVGRPLILLPYRCFWHTSVRCAVRTVHDWLHDGQ